MFVIVWQYQVRAGFEPEFERVYCSDGDWAQLFQNAPGFLYTELLRDLNVPGKYMTVDHWTTPEAFAQFKLQYHEQYETMDQRCGALTTEESFIGEFDLVDQT
jgi:heme-degrading monooxygenase HmoA